MFCVYSFSTYNSSIQYQPLNGFVPYTWIPGASYPSPGGETQLAFASPGSEAPGEAEDETDLSEYIFHLNYVLF